MNTTQVMLAIVLSAAITFFLRALPFLIFREKRQMPEKMMALGKMLPPAIMAVLIVYCVKDVRTAFLPNGLFELLAVAVTAVSYKIKHQTFLSILLGTASYMVLLHVWG